MASFLQRFVEQPLIGGDKPDGPAAALVERATAEALNSPDWGVNMELCDMINLNVHEHGKDAARALRRRIANGTPKTQLLALTTLEACVKNCGRRFHEFVAQKEVLLAMSKLGGSRRTEPEVRDKALALIQDWADAIRLAPYRDTFAELQQRGVDFPGRDVARMAPVHTPPVSVPTGDDLSAADAEAIALAIAQAEQEIATEEQRRVEEKTRAHVREHMDGGYDFMNARKAEKRLLHHKPSEYMAVPTAGEYVAPAPVYAPDARAANRPAYWSEAAGASSPPGPGSAAGFAASPPRVAPPPPPRAPADMSVVRATLEVLGDMLRSVDASRPADVLDEPVFGELAGQCRGVHAPALLRVIEAATEEAALAEALALNDELQRLLEVHEYLFAQARAQQAAAGGGASGGAGASGSPPPPLPPKPARLASGGLWAAEPASTGGAPDAARLAMRERARSRGAALLAEAGAGGAAPASVRLPPPPPSRPRATAADSPQPSSFASSPPPSSIGADLLSGSGLESLSPPSASPASLAAASVAVLSPVGAPAAAVASTDPFEELMSAPPAGFSAGAAYTNPSFDAFAQPPAVPSPGALAADLERRATLSPPRSTADVFDSLPPVAPVGGEAVAPPPPASVASPWAAAGPGSMRPPTGAAASSPPSAGFASSPPGGAASADHFADLARSAAAKPASPPPGNPFL